MRHAARRFAGGNQRESIRISDLDCARQGFAYEPRWFYSVDRRVENLDGMVAKTWERMRQCCCEGSVQPERPVTALNLRSKPLIT